MFSSCSSKIFLPIYNPTPKVEVNPYVNILDSREVPAPSTESLEFALYEEKVPTDYENAKHVPILYNAANPHIAISIPEIDVASTKDENEVKKSKLYESGDFYVAEQQIELALMRKQYTVINRDIYLAEISKARENVNTLKPLDDILSRLVENKNHESTMEELNKMIENGELTKEESLRYEEEWKNYQNRIYQPANALLESQIIMRVAKDLGSNFILHINDVSFKDLGERKFYIKDIPAVKSFMKVHPELKFGNLPEALPLYINSVWLKAYFSAKLTDVLDGKLLWNGEFEVESINSDSIMVLFRVQKFVDNADVINNAIAIYNSNLYAKKSDVKENGEHLQRVYNQASYERKFKTKEERMSYESNLRTSIMDLESKYKSSISQLTNLNGQPPSEASMEFTYSYLISEPFLEPDLSTETQDNELEEFYIKHKERLIKNVVNQLIQTIDLTRP